MVYAKPRQEEKVARGYRKLALNPIVQRNLLKDGIQIEKKVEIPLFTSYCFVNLEDKERNKVFQVSGILRYLFWLKKPAVVKDEEISEIKRWLDNYDHNLIETIIVKNNDHLIIKSGILANKKAVILKTK